ncbi:MAG: exodeoxyribonuclease VII small subunit [Planctomycetes bacterium]|nr:exodeoxyribonuclease VII small subunit [Planctomycetota bacterium]
MSAARKPPTYAEAAAELESILEKIEAGEADVDQVVALVRRGTELIRFCRERLDAARLEVGKVVADLDALEQQAGEAQDDDDEDEDSAPSTGSGGDRLPF